MEICEAVLCEEVGLRGSERVGCEVAAADGVGWGCLECEEGWGWWGEGGRGRRVGF